MTKSASQSTIPADVAEGREAQISPKALAARDRALKAAASDQPVEAAKRAPKSKSRPKTAAKPKAKPVSKPAPAASTPAPQPTPPAPFEPAAN